MVTSPRTCPRCGRTVTETARICIGCGLTLLPVLATQPAENEVGPPTLTTPPPPSSPLAGAHGGPPPSSPPAGAHAGALPVAGPLAGSSPPPEGLAGSPRPPLSPPSPTPGTAVDLGPPPAAGAGVQYGWTPAAPGPPLLGSAPFPRPDLSPARALRRVAARSTLTAGMVAGVLAAMVITAGTALVALLFWGAHLAGGCTAEASLARDCAASGANGYLASWTAVLWSVAGGGEVLGTSSGISAPVRIPLGLGILLVGGVLYLAGRLTVRMLFLRNPADAAIRSLSIAATVTAVLALVGALVTARADGFALGPDYSMLILWGVGLGAVASYLGILRATFPRSPRRALGDRVTRPLGPLAPMLAAAWTGLGVALALALLAGVVAMATHAGDTANASRFVVGLTTTKAFPDGVLGTVATVVLLVLGALTWAAWVLVYSLIFPVVSVAGVDYGLTSGDHDAYLWVVVLVPVLATLFTGYAGARLRRAGTVEAAVVGGGGAGLIWGLLAWLAVLLLNGDHGAGWPPGSRAAGIGPELGPALGFLLLWGVVGGAVGGYAALLTVARRPSRLPLFRRYSAAVVGPPKVPVTPACPVCALVLSPQAVACPRCGTSLLAPGQAAVPAPTADPEAALYGRPAFPPATDPAVPPPPAALMPERLPPEVDSAPPV